MTTTTQEMNKKQEGFPSAILIASIVLAVAGIGAWIYQLVQGMVVTGLGNQVVWGMYIAGFFAVVGAGAGLLSLVGLSEFMPLIREDNREKALSLALVSFIAGGVLIMMDLGSPFRIWKMVMAFEVSSMMTWDFWLLALTGVIALVYLLMVRKGGSQPVLGVLAIASAASVVAVEGWMLSIMAARPMFAGGLTVFSFLLSALAAGLGLGLLIMKDKQQLQGWMKVVLIANLTLVLAEVLTGLLTGSEEIALVLGGAAAPGFWFHLIAGIAVPLWLLFAGQSQDVAGGLVIAGVLAEKIWMLEAGQAFPMLELPMEGYTATWVEYLAIVGVVALGVLLYLLYQQFVPKGKDH